MGWFSFFSRLWGWGTVIFQALDREPELEVSPEANTSSFKGKGHPVHVLKCKVYPLKKILTIAYMEILHILYSGTLDGERIDGFCGE